MGAWSLFLSITTMLETSKGGLIKNALIKFINSSDHNDHAKIETASLIINLLITLLSIVAILAFATSLGTYWHISELDSMLYWYIGTLVLLVPFSHFEYMQQAHHDFNGILKSYLVRQGILFLLVVTSIWLPVGEHYLRNLVIFQMTGVGIGALVGYRFARRFIAQQLTYSKVWVGKLWSYGKFVFATSLSSLIFRSTDHIMVASYISTAAVALYNVSIRVTNLMDIPSTVAAEVMFPKSVKITSEEGTGRTRYMYEKSVGIILAFILPMSTFIMIFPEEVIRLIAGEQYLDATELLQITIIYSLFLPFLKQFGTMMDATGKPNVNFLLIFFLAILNIISNYLFIQYFGLLGAAYGTLFTYLISFVANQLILRKEFGVSSGRVIRQIPSTYRDVLKQVRQQILKQ